MSEGVSDELQLASTSCTSQKGFMEEGNMDIDKRKGEKLQEIIKNNAQVASQSSVNYEFSHFAPLTYQAENILREILFISR